MAHQFAWDSWTIIGSIGQLLFGFRFVVQWIASERRQRSVVPRSFWYLSISGGALVLAYAVHLRNPVFIVPQVTGLMIYIRNLWLSRGAAPAAESD